MMSCVRKRYVTVGRAQMVHRESRVERSRALAKRWGVMLVVVTTVQLCISCECRAEGNDARATASAQLTTEQPRLPVPPPDGAIVLFDGSPNHLFVSMNGGPIDWPIEDGGLTSKDNGGRQNHIVSTLHFRDADIHVEFMLPPGGEGNSGVYIHGNYELQIYNSPMKRNLTDEDIGALYGFSRPLTYAGRAAGVWQAYDIRYRAPRRAATGAITRPGVVTAYLNGIMVHEHTTFGEPRSCYHPFRHGTTPYLKKIWGKQMATQTGPVFLQDHDAPVQFRNIWVRPLDDRAYIYEPRGAPSGQNKPLHLPSRRTPVACHSTP